MPDSFIFNQVLRLFFSQIALGSDPPVARCRGPHRWKTPPYLVSFTLNPKLSAFLEQENPDPFPQKSLAGPLKEELEALPKAELRSLTEAYTEWVELFCVSTRTGFGPPLNSPS